ncbi:MAG TPA: 50S ribosomal protein L11 methyltransferase [Geobacteraceae bacterium]
MTTKTIWAEVSCEVPAAMVDQLSEFLVELSGGGVSIENLSVDTFSLDTLEDSPVKNVKAYFPADTGLEGKVAEIAAFLAAVGPSFPGFVFRAPEVGYLREEDWANNWKEHFKPSRIGTRLVIKPTWEAYEARESDIIIELDPGMAFGTGTHPTTRLCLESLERIYCHAPPFDSPRLAAPADVLDVGTGSGVLAIAAAKMGAARVTGIDIDPGAVEVANLNLAQNHVEDVARVTSEPLEKIPGSYDIVLANILAEELVRLGGELVGRLKAGGILILSGILTEKEELVLTGFSPYPLTLVELTRSAEWSCLAYRREG